MTFIHQEVYKDNEVAKGLRKAARLQPSNRAMAIHRRPLRARGARLEGSFGVRAFEDAIQAALR